MTRDEFVAGLIQRDRNVMQKTERATAARARCEELAAGSRSRTEAEDRLTRAEEDLEATLIERADYIADYAEEIRPNRGAIQVNVRFTNLDDIRTLVERLVSRPSGAHGPGTPAGPITDLGDGELRESRQVGEGRTLSNQITSE